MIQAEESKTSLKNTALKKSSSGQESLAEEPSSHPNIWEKIQLARHPDRPHALDFIRALFRDFQELHGDRRFGDDAAIVAGTAYFQSLPVMVIGEQKGRTVKENLTRRFGCPQPEGYRKAMRLMQMADTFQLPILTFVDTPGAYPGIESEERHVAEAIAVNLREMMRLSVPIIAVVISEGGSGGALGIAVADRVLILENAYYSVISPEACAAILWKDRSFASEAAEALQLSSENLLRWGVADEVIAEEENAHVSPDKVFDALRTSLIKHLTELSRWSAEERMERRYQRFRVIGSFAV
ncbi:MAG: acetyl-CoA carboxylase carboxyltransferase subunit alpha [Puniceicoccales bacterium]|jgi:acetyl-CoA carboxylase carboxyl transferase subunit alpha|nr:acetyl-CoA carboxylase carboxyltransferase subunit alpha [Puniceicoccales bacterium]